MVINHLPSNKSIESGGNLFLCTSAAEAATKEITKHSLDFVYEKLYRSFGVGSLDIFCRFMLDFDSIIVKPAIQFIHGQKMRSIAQYEGLSWKRLKTLTLPAGEPVATLCRGHWREKIVCNMCFYCFSLFRNSNIK